MHDLSTQINRLLAASKEAAVELTKTHGQVRTPEDVRQALVAILAVDDEIALLDRDLSTDDMVRVLHGFSFEKPEVLAEVEFEKSIIPENVPIALREAVAKHRNEIWVVHKYDADPFPSNPHAHNELNGLKLHLGTGELFSRRRRLGKIRRKDLLAIRSKLAGIMLPALASEVET